MTTYFYWNVYGQLRRFTEDWTEGSKKKRVHGNPKSRGGLPEGVQGVYRMTRDLLDIEDYPSLDLIDLLHGGPLHDPSHYDK